MSYVLANTQNNLGRRGLGKLRGLGWDDAPYPVYKLSRSVARLNGDISPAGTASGAITYRIDPRSGQYQFYRTDIKPRGVFMQNTFQHPAPPTLSALGTRVLPIGKSISGSTLQRGRTSRGPMIAMRPGVTLSGLGCGSCGGRCNTLDGPRFARRRQLAGPLDGCTLDADGNFTCPPDTSSTPTGAAFQPGGIFSDPSSFAPGPSPVATAANAVAQGIQQVVQTATGPRVVVQQQPSWFNQASNIGGANVPNAVLAIGGVLFAALGLEGSRGRR
jgi:hypothetical protein